MGYSCYLVHYKVVSTGFYMFATKMFSGDEKTEEEKMR